MAVPRTMSQWPFALFITFCILCLLNKGDAYTLGIDYGSEYLKIAGPDIRNGITILLNEVSQRKTENYIGFRLGERYIGSSAKTLAARFPLQTAASVNKLLVDPLSEELQQFKDNRYEYVVDVDEYNLLSVPLADAHGPFSAIELNAMMLSYSAKIAAKSGVPEPRSAVIVSPANFSLHDRVLLNQAAKLAGIYVLAFVDSVTATAYYYGIRERGFANQTVLLAIIDIGASKTEVGVFRFSPDSSKGRRKEFGFMEKIAGGSDFSFGGRALDLCIAEVMEEEAIKKLKIPKVIGGKSKEGLKSQFSLLRAARAVRETLSVNSKTPYTVEGIAPDRDFSSTFSRSTFEKKCSALFKKVPQLVDKVLKESNIPVKSFTAIEFMGGVSRTPKLISDLSHLLHREVSRTLNMDEAAAMGAGYYAARLSPFYRTIGFQHRQNFSYQLFFSLSPPLNTQVVKRPLVLHDTEFGSLLSITVNRSSDFSIMLSADANEHGEDNGGESTIAEIAVHVNRGLHSLRSYNRAFVNENNTHLIRIQLRFSEAGLLEVEDVLAVVRFSTADAAGRIPSDGNATEDDTVHLKKIPLHHEVKWYKPFLSSNLEERNSLKLKTIDLQEEEKHERSHAKNLLESFVFSTRNLLEDSTALAKVEENAVIKLKNSLTSLQEWLEEGQGGDDSCPKAEYDSRLEFLQQNVQEFLHPKNESEKIPTLPNNDSTGLEGPKNESEKIPTLTNNEASGLERDL